MSANRFCDRFITCAVISTVSGTEISTTRASGGDSQNINASTPITVKMLLSICARVCCSDWAMLSMSLVTRLSNSPRG